MKDIVIDELIRSKRKTVSLTITKDAKLLVRAPLRLPLKEIDKIIEEKKNWIITNKYTAIEKLKQFQRFYFTIGGHFLFLGNQYALSMDERAKTIIIKEGKLIIPSRYGDNVGTALKKWCIKQGREILQRRLAELSDKIGIPYSGCSVTSARRRWGSCSRSNRINLTWRLIMANQQAIDYVIIHELCHVIHKNHSKAFWQKVGKIMPDYALHKRWLKDNAYILDLFD